MPSGDFDKETNGCADRIARLRLKAGTIFDGPYGLPRLSDDEEEGRGRPGLFCNACWALRLAVL